MQWLLINIGCIECGVSSNVVGVFDSKVMADNLAAQLEKTHGWREGGQNVFEVFPLPAPNTVHPDYTV